MPRQLSHLLLLLYIVNSACTFDKQEIGSTLNSSKTDSLEALQEEPIRNDTTDFQDAFEQFSIALQAADTVALNRFIHPELGIWLIEQPGAVPAYAHFRSIQAVRRSYQNLPFASLKEQVQACELQERQEFPEFSCAWMDQGRSGFTEDGCFYHNATDFKTTDMWRYASLSPQQEQQVQETQRQVQKTILHTRSSFRFHFAYDGAHWRLLFVDLRVPCSA